MGDQNHHNCGIAQSEHDSQHEAHSMLQNIKSYKNNNHEGDSIKND